MNFRILNPAILVDIHITKINIGSMPPLRKSSISVINPLFVKAMNPMLNKPCQTIRFFTLRLPTHRAKGTLCDVRDGRIDLHK